MTNLRKNLNGGIISQNSKVFFNSSLKTAQELANDGAKLEPIKSIWGTYILENSLVHNPSERGTGKTLLSLQLCLAISSGWKTFCGEQIEVNGNTLLLNFELNEHVIKRRMDHLFRNPRKKSIRQRIRQEFIPRGIVFWKNYQKSIPW